MKGWRSPANGPYGAPRGNRAMASKRTHGISANEQLRIHVALEHCKEPGCRNPVLVTKHPNGITRERICAAHIPRPAPQRTVAFLLDLGNAWTGKV